jgi:proteasome lid subunit RPN8/RPN11
MNIYIEPSALLKLWAYVDAVDTEIGGMGYAYRDGEDLVWQEVFLLPQVSSGAEVDFEVTNGDEYAINKAAQEGVLGQPGFVWVSWHSHANMATYWSTTDTDRINGLAKTGLPYLLSFVGNKKREYKLRMDYFNVKHHDLSIPIVTRDELQLIVDPQAVMMAEVYDDIEKCYTKKTYKNVKAVTKQVGPPKDTEPGYNLERSFTIRALMDSGMDRLSAEKVADELEQDELKQAQLAAATIVAENEAMDALDVQAWGELGVLD